MKIAIASEGNDVLSMVSDQGGRAPFYLIYEDDKLIKTWENSMATGGGGAGYGVVSALADMGVEKIVVGKVGGNMREALEERKIECLEKSGMTVKEMIGDLIKYYEKNMSDKNSRIGNSKCRIQNLPVSFFSVVMGLAGFTIAWQKAEEVLKLDWGISRYALWFSMGVFVVLLGLYLWKMVFYWKEVVKEYDSSIKLNFFPTISINLLLLAIALSGVNPIWSFWLWLIGAVMHFVFTLLIISIWIGEKTHDVEYMNPAWFIPVVGNILVPVVGVQYVHPDVSWFYFAIGFVFWMVLFTIVFYRVIFHHPIAKKLVPTLFIMVAPPSVGFIAYYKLTGQLDSFAKILYFFALFLFVFLIVRIYSLWKSKFYLSWWAYSFPSASMTIATILYMHVSGISECYYLAGGLLAILSLIIMILLIRTVIAIGQREICIEE